MGMQIGAITTRDGKRIGNGYLYSIDEEKTEYSIETDFGNFVVLNEIDVFKLFHQEQTLDPPVSYKQWRSARNRKRIRM